MLLRTVSAATAETTVGVINRNTFFDLFKRSTSLSHLTQTHAQIILHGFRNDIVLVTKLTQRLSDLGAIHYARDLFLSVERPDEFLCNVIMRGFSNNELHHSSLSVFAHLRKSTDLKPNSSTYTYAISAASGFRDERAGRAIHGQAVVGGFDSEDLINESCTRLDSTTLLNILPAVAELQELRLGMQIHSLATKTGCYSHVFVLTGFISVYSKCGKIELLSTLFREFRVPDVVAYNAMIHGYASNGETELSLRLFKELVLSGTRLLVS
ncbi:unnamed protein product [Thlaspi arvense]|uniref:Pentatricopeptide repeat-containing protein n=1 Tax=Thlaspi arvense TaxID=13288 RepID=A0AAU9T3I7_THLAR|nr:unnamed protein product [Thlaspi arvense]